MADAGDVIAAAGERATDALEGETGADDHVGGAVGHAVDLDEPAGAAEELGAGDGGGLGGGERDLADTLGSARAEGLAEDGGAGATGGDLAADGGVVGLLVDAVAGVGVEAADADRGALVGEVGAGLEVEEGRRRGRG